MGAPRKLIRAAVALTLTLLASRASAQDRPFTDPGAGHDPFGDAGAPVDAGPATDPSTEPDPFRDASTTSTSTSTSAAADAASKADLPVLPRPSPYGEEPPPSPSPSPAPRPRPPHDDLSVDLGPARLRLRLLLQPQFAWSFFNAAASPNADASGSLPPNVGANATVGRADGTTTNRGTFRVRRARVGFELETRSFVGAVVEIDPNLADRENPASGSIVRRLELLAVHHTRRRALEIGAGVFDVPFSRDLLEPHGARIFVERAFGTRAMFPEDADMGVRVRRTYVPLGLDVQLAVVNGVTVGEPSFGHAPDLNKTKDVVGRIALDQRRFAVGIGGYAGQGQAVDPVNLRVQQRPRAALAIDALFRARFIEHRETRLFGEVVVGRNMDRGVYTPYVEALPADPSVSLPNYDSQSAWIRLEQDFRAGTIGVRYDVYTPDASQADNARQTIAVAIARRLTRHALVALEYDHAVDRIHLPDAPAPTKLVDMISLLAQLRY